MYCRVNGVSSLDAVYSSDSITGGAAITRKEELETVNEPVLAATTLHLKEAMGLPFATVSMDWSRKEEGGVIADLVPNCSGQNLEFPNAFIIVHGAGW